jgi:hypothetical protein
VNIEPTFTCFDDALELINERVHEDPTTVETLTLVHGLATGARGDVYAHAWVEDGEHCWDSGQVDGQRVYYAVVRAEFYAARQIVGSTRYTVREACLANLQSGHYGPWRPEYRMLCGGRRITGSIPATYEPDSHSRTTPDDPATARKL